MPTASSRPDTILEHRESENDMEAPTDSVMPKHAGQPDEPVRSVTIGTRADARSKASPFIYLGALYREYELFCLDNDLDIQHSRDALQRHVVRRYNVYVKQLEVSRLRGLRWSDVATDSFWASQNSTSLNKEDHSAPLVEPPRHWLRKFIEEWAVVTKQPSDWLDLKTGRAPPNGEIRPGVISTVKAWCQEKHYKYPDFSSVSWEESLPPGVSLRRQIRVRQICGVRWRSSTARSCLGMTPCSQRPPKTWYAIEAFAVFVHVMVFYGSSIILVLLAAFTTNKWAVIAQVAGGASSTPMLALWPDIVQPCAVMLEP